jgi:hypothetical protein
MKKRLPVLLMFVVLALSSLVCALPGEAATDHSEFDPLGVWNVVLGGSIAIVLFSIIAIAAGSALHEWQKKALFGMLCVIIAFATIYIVGTTIYLNVSSATKGPVHWHIDFEIWNCDEQIDLLDPSGLSNKIGSPVFHEHNDNRVHVEGPVVKHTDVNLRNFFAIIGGSFDYGKLSVPTNGGVIEMSDGMSCNGETAKLQAFLFKVQNPDDHNNWVFTQTKLENAPEYVMSPQAAILPGDCVVFELAPEKPVTDKICESYAIAVERGVARGS